MANNRPSHFMAQMLLEMRHTRSKVIRVHCSGDFFSQRYVDSWAAIADSHPDWRFYCYTKALEIFDFSALRYLPNFNVINSICFDGLPNYGDAERMNLLADEGYHICQGTTKAKKGPLCGRDCTWCHIKGNDKVAFKQH